jgi:hypothetical protein
VTEKDGRMLFDRPKPTMGCSASGRRRRRRRRRRRSSSLVKSRKVRRAGAVICMMGGFNPTYSKENTTLKT